MLTREYLIEIRGLTPSETLANLFIKFGTECIADWSLAREYVGETRYRKSKGCIGKILNEKNVEESAKNLFLGLTRMQPELRTKCEDLRDITYFNEN